MINKKELEKELELVKKGDYHGLKGMELDKVSELEKRVLELEILVKLHSDDFKHAAECLESNEGIMRMLDERVDELEGKFVKLR